MKNYYAIEHTYGATTGDSRKGREGNHLGACYAFPAAKERDQWVKDRKTDYRSQGGYREGTERSRQPRGSRRDSGSSGLPHGPGSEDIEMTQKQQQFELIFVGSATVTEYRIPRYRRMHKTLESATDTARKVWEAMSERGLPTACHTPIVYGPGCGKDGTPVRPW